MSKIYLVGSGIGRIDYLTLKGKEIIKTADAIVYDSLIPTEVLSFVQDSCQKIFVGKRKGLHYKSQEEINQLLVDLSKSHNRVVRLKAGDPFLFGRVGEEIEYLKNNGVNFEVIPGISSVQALEVLLNIPLTHRDFNHSVQILTGHDLDSIDFNNLADFKGNIIILMGVSNIKEICINLIKAGKDPITPIALISDLNKQPVSCIKGTLQSFSKISEKFKSPGLILLGEILNHLDRFQQEKLKILVTRNNQRLDRLSENLEDFGLTPIKIPLIRINENKNNIKQLQNAIRILQKYTYLIFTSPTGVDIFFDVFRKSKKDIRDLSDLKICAIGPGTSQALNQYCLEPDFIPDEYSSNGIVKLLKDKLSENDRILIPRSNSSTNTIKNNLSQIATVDEIGIYDIIEEKPDLNSIIKNNEIAHITATSSSIAKNLSTLLDDDLKNKVKVYSIGKETTKGLKGFPNIVESKIFSIDGLAETIKNDITNTIKEK